AKEGHFAIPTSGHDPRSREVGQPCAVAHGPTSEPPSDVFWSTSRSSDDLDLPEALPRHRDLDNVQEIADRENPGPDTWEGTSVPRKDGNADDEGLRKGRAATHPADPRDRFALSPRSSPSRPGGGRSRLPRGPRPGECSPARRTPWSRPTPAPA